MKSPSKIQTIPDTLNSQHITELSVPNTSSTRLSSIYIAMSTYTIQAGDTFSSIATTFNTTVAAIEAANPGVNPDDLQIGQTINLPGAPTTVTYTIQAGDTFSSIATQFQTTVAAIENVNPGVNPDNLQIGQVINLPTGTQPPPSNGYVPYTGPASNFPASSQWEDFSSLWSFNAGLMGGNDSQSEINDIGQSIQQVASESGFDPRAILCIIMQESGGNVNVGDTTSPGGVKNTGIMQSHDGVDFDPNNAAGSILQMIKNGTEGTSSGDGLVQCLQKHPNIYEAFRAYNSGSVDPNDLGNAFGATSDYVSRVANRLQGHVWAGM